MAGGVYYPPAPQNGSNQPANFPYDVVIQESFPGVVFYPTEVGGVYSVIREVDGNLWLVNNADWNGNTSQWEQNAPSNAGNAAYALVLAANGSHTRYATPPTNIPGTAISWTQLHNIAGDGSVQSTPTPPAGSPGISDQLSVTWSAGTSSKMFARVTSITDTASEADSVYDYLIVNGVGKWLVDKNGVLQEGTIPFARVTGFSPVFNNATFTGTTTFQGPVVTQAGITNTGDISTATLHASGAVTAGSFALSGGGFLSDAPTTTTANVTIASPGSSMVLTTHASHGYAVGTTLLVDGTGTNPTESFTAIVTARNSQPSTSLTVTVIAILSGTAGDTLNSGAVVGYTTVTRLESTDSSVSVVNAGTPVSPVYNLTIPPTKSFPAVTQNTFTVPNVGSVVNVNIKALDSLPYVADQFVWIYGNGGTPQFLGKLGTGSAIGGGIIQIPVTNLEVTQGLVGQSVGAGAGYMTFGSYDPNLFSKNIVISNMFRPAPGSYPFSTSISLPPLPGTASNNYRVYCSMTFDTNGTGSQSLTGSGAAWEAPITEPDFGGPQPIDLYGTAVGGNSPSVVWAATGVGGTGYIGVLQLYAYPQ